VIAHPLQVVRDLERRGDEAQIPRQRLLESEQAQTAVVDVELEPVDHLVVREHLARQRGVAAPQRVDRLEDDALGAPAHAQELLLELLEIVFEVPLHCFS